MPRHPLLMSGLCLGMAVWAFILSMRMNPISDLARFQELATTSTVAPAAMRTGAEIYLAECASCHHNRGEGRFPVFPPLAGSERVNGDIAPLIAITLHGLSGPITSNDVHYSGLMPGLSHLDDGEMAAVLTHVRSAWGNSAASIIASDVAAIRQLTASRRAPWTTAELEAYAAVAERQP